MFDKAFRFLSQQKAHLEKAIEFRQNAKRTISLVKNGKLAVHSIDHGSRRAVILQYKVLMDIIKNNADTQFGREYGFSEIHSVDDYRRKVPLTDYDTFEPYIRRMMAGEKNLLTARDPQHFAITSGSVGTPKYIPVSAQELEKYATYSVAMAFGVADEYYRNTTGRSVPAGLGLNAVEMRVMQTDAGIGKGSISGTVLNSMKDYVPDLLSSPWEIVAPDGEMDIKYLKTRLALGVRNLAFMDSVFLSGLVDLMDYIRDNYRMLCKDIYYGRIDPDVNVPQSVRTVLESQLRPDKERARELMREFSQGFDEPIIPRIWPRMSWIGGIGTGSFTPYVRKMRRYSGKTIPFNNLCYAASESFMAVARHMSDTSFVLIPDGGFYEFIPVHGKNQNKTLTIEELEVGADYEIVVTNLSGFYRYRLKDVVRVTGFYNEAPMIRFNYRKDQLISIAGEKTNEEALRWAITQFSLEASVHVNDYSIYADDSTSPGHYVILVEPDQIVPKESLTHFREIMENKLMQANPAYGDMRRAGSLGPLELVFLQQQTYQLYRDLMIMKGFSANQLKPPRIIDNPMKERFFFGLKETYDE